MLSTWQIRNPDSIPTKLSGFGCCEAEPWEIPPNVPPKWRDRMSQSATNRESRHESRHHVALVGTRSWLSFRRKPPIPMSLNESIVEDAALAWLGDLGYAVGHGPQLAPGEPAAEREPERSRDSRRQSFGEVVLVGRLCEAIRRLNPDIPTTPATLCGTLLPKLLRGELSVADAEPFERKNGK